MAQTEGSLIRGQKRIHSEVEGSRGEPKRPRLEASTIFGRVRIVVSNVWNYFVGSPREERRQVDMTDEDNDISIVNDSTNPSMETIHASEPSLLDSVVRTDKDEVQLVKVVNSTTSKSFNNPSMPSSSSTSLGRFYGGAYNITTKQKRDKEREDRRPSNVLNSLRHGSTPPKHSLVDNPRPSWRNNLPIDKPVLKNRPNYRYTKGIQESFRMDDLAKYRNAYEKVLLCPDQIIAKLQPNWRRGLNDVTSSPFFSRQPHPALKCGAITKVQLNMTETNSIVKRIMSKQTSPPLILLDHDDTDDIEVVPLPPPPKPREADDDVIEIVDIFSPRVAARADGPSRKSKNQLESDLSLQSVCQDTFLEDLMNKYDTRMKQSDLLIQTEIVKLDHSREINEKIQAKIEDRLKNHLKITEVSLEDPEVEEVAQMPEITLEMEAVINTSLKSGNQVLIDAFSIPIKRTDIETLCGLNWLNDEIVNFYLQMIVERSNNQKKWPRVYATNTFFYPRLMKSGHSALKRWTKKIDVFAHDLILIPVHLGMHWCLAAINLKDKTITYYDSMNGSNERCLNALEQYLQDEHMDKKNTSFDTSKFKKVHAKNIPQQMNGSDCGMFALKFSEYLSRSANITFTQKDMPYFRRRMIYEIVKKQLMHP